MMKDISMAIWMRLTSMFHSSLAHAGKAVTSLLSAGKAFTSLVCWDLVLTLVNAFSSL